MRITKLRILSWIFILTLFIVSSCADYRTHYSKENQEWQALEVPTEAITHTMYLIGDTGGSTYGQPIPPALQLLGDKLKIASEQTSVVFLGDNIYPDGMAPKDDVAKRAEDEYRLKAQLDVVKDFPGRAFFIAGNHDWKTYGLEGLKRQKKFIEKYLDNNDVFFPKPGCGDPKEIELNDQLTLILVDSEWFLTDWDGQYDINDGCEIKSKEVFQRYFEEAVKGNRNKNIVVAVHHPPYSNGPHGGDFTVKQHFFPLTDLSPGLYLPLPGLGSIAQFFRGNLGDKQDLAHPQYQDFANLMVSSARKNGQFIFASGHEHNLQYFEKEDQYFIVSGAGSKRSPSKKGDDAAFAYGHSGFAQVDFYEDGSAWLQFWVPDGSPSGMIVFKKKIKGPLKDAVIEEKTEFPVVEAVTKRPLSQVDFSQGALGRFFWGKHYRKSFSIPIDMATLDMAQFRGGVTPIKRGGGYQTNSLRLEKEDNKQFAMRSIDKDASRTLTYPFSESNLVTSILQDNFSASHPLSALPVPKLASAVNVYHANPELYYVPQQEKLGIFNADFGNAIYLLEERPDDSDWKDAPNFGNSKKIVGTNDVIQEVFNSHNHLIDYNWAVRSRIFDVLIGDWDRHDDQWRWARIDDGSEKYYRPIPRDRDQAFSNYDGLILGIGRQTAPNVKKLLVYKDKLKTLKWIAYNGRHFDRTFLAGLDWEGWQKEIQTIKTGLTDEVIESAFKESWPKEIYDLDAAKIMHTLKTRRNNIDDIARRYYELLARKVDVIGTEKKDLFEVERLDDERTRVRVYDTNNDGEKKDKIYDRTFLASETKEIILYGLDADDFFNLSGEVSNGIKVRVVAGLGDDVITNASKVGGMGKKTIVYDSKPKPVPAGETPKENNTFFKGPDTRLKLKSDPLYNTLNRRSLDYEYNFSSVLPLISFNPDDGLLLGLNGTYTTYGFKKSPYATFHQFTGQYALATSGMALNYRGDFTDVFGKWNLELDTRFQTPLYAINFYGFGNETENPEITEDADPDFNRVRQRLFYIKPAITRKFNDRSLLSFGPTFESIRVDSTEGRFINEFRDELDPETFDGLEFIGVRALFKFVNHDDPAFPTRGIDFNTEFGWKTQLDDTSQEFFFLNTHLATYLPIDKKGSLVIGTRLGLQVRFIDTGELVFYQGAILGGVGPNSNIRGFRRDRFTGRRAFYQNIDLRWKFLKSGNPQLPFSMGIFGGFDHGRVWLSEDKEDSNLWHYSYGGGLFISPLDVAAIHVSMFWGDGEQQRFSFGGAFFF